MPAGLAYRTAGGVHAAGSGMTLASATGGRAPPVVPVMGIGLWKLFDMKLKREEQQ